jgi:hypothetical protein
MELAGVILIAKPELLDVFLCLQVGWQKAPLHAYAFSLVSVPYSPFHDTHIVIKTLVDGILRIDKRIPVTAFEVFEILCLRDLFCCEITHRAKVLTEEDNRIAIYKMIALPSTVNKSFTIMLCDNNVVG